MSFARHHREKPLFSHTDIVSARERALVAENRQLREKNKRLKDAMLTLVERIETQLPYLKEQSQSFEQPKHRARDRDSARDKAYRERFRRYRAATPPKMEVYETFHEPIEFGEPAPEMRFGTTSQRTDAKAAEDDSTVSHEYFISPELAPEEIDILKSPTRDRRRQNPVLRETVDIVDLHPADHSEADAAERYEPGDTSFSDVPAFEFPEDEPVVDIDFERKESLRAAMRRRVNRLRW
ncbi:hypothetical protein GQF03_14580 [Sneathiella chungangensis]|uniref:Uncharacterized protein n=1 Tax=Sneathiella chungangensis TaxID=1418234 RepID=A0A845MIW6_9PROT|nr:hypothetical protein [Sneathiella chungangensis]MZR23562.1 hypothetical protein [Sneathiella chungangensis]